MESVTYYLSNRNRAEQFEQTFECFFQDKLLYEPFNVVKAGSGISIPIILDSSPHAIRIGQWGFMQDPEPVDGYSKSLKGEISKLDVVLGRGLVKEADGRCLVLADGLFAYNGIVDTGIPYYLYHDDYLPFGIPGYYKYHGEDFYSVCIVVDPNWSPFFSNRFSCKNGLPAVLEKELEMKWLKRDLSTDSIRNLLSLKTSNPFTAHSITKSFSDIEYENYNVLNPVTYPDTLREVSSRII
ncbi:MAG: hypothetical protein AAGA43_13565 [Bacteroidota bacterium]